jgi:primosomal protein N'
MKPEKALRVLNQLRAVGFVDDDEKGARPHNSDQRQFKSDVSTSRVKRFRERHRDVRSAFYETAPEAEAEAEAEVKAPSQGGMNSTGEAPTRANGRRGADMKRELRPHQAKAIEMLRQSLGSGKRRPVLQAPTGFGKTRLAAAVVEGALAKQKRVISTVPALSLVDQTVRAFWNDGIRDVGVFQGTNPMTDWSRPVQVASVQTLQRRPIPQADLALIDECHRWFDFHATYG